MKQWIPHVTVAAVIKKDYKYLMVEEVINGEIVINQPAGHWEKSESIIEAVQREALEETSYLVDTESLIGIYNWTIPESENASDSIDTFLRFTFECTITNKTDNALDPDINRYLWLTEEDIRSSDYKKRSPLVLKSLDDYVNGQRYSLSQFTDMN